MGSLDDSKSPIDRVVLNVGGTRFETTKQTLCTYPDSMLAKMMDPVSPFFQDGEPFIDRDPTCFASILNYLRMGSIAVAYENDKYRESLALEAEFYGLPIFQLPLPPKPKKLTAQEAKALAKISCEFHIKKALDKILAIIHDDARDGELERTLSVGTYRTFGKSDVTVPRIFLTRMREALPVQLRCLGFAVEAEDTSDGFVIVIIKWQ